MACHLYACSPRTNEQAPSQIGRSQHAPFFFFTNQVMSVMDEDLILASKRIYGLGVCLLLLVSMQQFLISAYCIGLPSYISSNNIGFLWTMYCLLLLIRAKKGLIHQYSISVNYRQTIPADKFVWNFQKKDLSTVSGQDLVGKGHIMPWQNIGSFPTKLVGNVHFSVFNTFWEWSFVTL